MRNFESRIVTLFILFFLGVQVAGFISLQRAQESKARLAMETELADGEQAIQRLLDQQTTALTDLVTRLVNGGEFVQSVAADHSPDRKKLESILASQAARLNASMAWIIGRDGRIQAASSYQLSAQVKQISTALVLQAVHQDYASTVVVNNHIPLQLIATLLRTPTTEVWVVMAFPLEKKFILEVEKVTSLPVTILVRNKQRWQVVSSGLSGPEALILAKNVPQKLASGVKRVMVNDTEYSVQMIALSPVQEPARQPSEEAIIIMQGSVSDMLAPYSELQIGLITITLIGLIIALYGNITFTKRISQPLRQLRDIAKRLGNGDYEFPIQVSGNEEISDLAHAFVSMRDGIAHRENEIKRLAYWDTLTDLPNRTQFTALLNQAIESAKAAEATNQSCFVVMMDLDRFKHVNDVMGHSFGDLLLKKVANRLREALPCSQLARLGG